MDVKKSSCFIYPARTLLKALFILLVLSVPFKSFAERSVTQSTDNKFVDSMQNQNKTISGVVTDTSGESIPGVTVIIKGTTRGTTTDIDGVFNLGNVPSNATLVFSFIGMNTKEVSVIGQTALNVVLEEEAVGLDEVVVVGYGTQRKENLTGAVSTINTEKALESRPITDVSKALQGISPGLNVTTNVGGPGIDSNIRLRGSIGSLNATEGTSPLILVDNVEIPSLSLVNPNDIESISVLKDAASASIYGTRAAWGVILITTKSGGTDGRVTVNYSNNFAWNTPTTVARQAETWENAEFALKGANRLGNSDISLIGYNVDEESVGKMKEWHEQYGHMSQAELGEMQMGRDMEFRGGRLFFYRSFDPIDEFTKKWTPQQKHDFSVSGGTKKSSYNIGLGYINQSGVMKYNTDSYDRYNFNSSITTQVNDWWKIKGNVLFTRSTTEQPYRYTAGLYDAWYYLMRWPRWYPYASYEGKDFRSALTDIKQANTERFTENFTRVSIGTEINPFKNLSINFDYTFSLLNDEVKRNGGEVFAYDMFATVNPLNSFKSIYYSSVDNRVLQWSKYSMSNIFKAYATYNLNLKNDHNFKFMVGFDSEERERLGHSSERRELIDMNKPEIALAIGDQFVTAVDYHNEFASRGYFGRVNYNYMQKYLFEVNARYDGSSKFPSGEKWALFPSLSAGWILSEESFMNWSNPVLSSLKLRGSWGTIGNQDVASNAFLSTMGVGSSSGWVQGGQQLPYVGVPSVISSALTWERVTTLDIGVDARFLNNKLGFSVDWYQRTTSDMHSPGETLPATFGASAPQINYGEMQGTGLEIIADYNHRFDNGLGLMLTATFSNVTEKITKYDNPTNYIYGYYEGKEIGEIWGYETDRLYQESDMIQKTDPSGNPVVDKDGKPILVPEGPTQELFESGNFKYGPGDVKYKDLNGDGKIDYGNNTLDDRGDLKRIGNTLPKFEYGFTIALDYKGFDLSTFFQGVGSRDFWAFGNVAIPNASGEALYEHQTDYWTPNNTNAFYPTPTNTAWVSHGQNFLRQSRYLSDMSYLRMKNLTLGYTLPRIISQKVLLEKARLYVSGENLFEFDNMDIPVDPETTEKKYNSSGTINSSGWSFGRSYPFSRTISFGIQLTL